MDGRDDRCEGERQEEEKEDAIGQIESEIAVLEEYLESMDQLEDESEEAIEMRSNVSELIELKRDQLLEWKKALLVERCEEQLRESGWREDAQWDLGGPPGGALGSIEYRYNNGRQGRRNVSIVAVGALGGDSCPTYRGFLCQPIDRWELPCRHEMRAIGSCERGDSCRYSHGLPLAPHDIGPPVDTSDCPLSPGDYCLCLPPDSDLWRSCRLVFVDPDADSFVVELVAFLSDRSERVIAVTRERLVRDAALDRSAGDGDPDPSTAVAEDLPPSAGAGMSSTFGQWERHTRGIGMKLLLKMGYAPNTGLGKHGQGRLNPIEVNVGSKPTNRKKPERTAPRNPVERSRPSSASVAENIKSSLARNEGELQGLQAKIESLERSKGRHSGCKILTGTADKKIGAIRHRIGELRQADKVLAKELSREQSKTSCDKPKKLKIF